MKHPFLTLAGPLTAALLLPQPLLAREASMAQTAAPDRVIPMEGGRNFRDVGGYRTSDGRVVKWKALYRSGSMANLTPEAISRFSTLGVTSIIDLRSTDERRRDPSNWQQAGQFGYWARDYGMGDMGGMGAYLANPANRTAAAMRTMMANSYRTLPMQQAASYRELFARLATPHKGAVVVNCTAGKDRTGIATALVLTALGVPYETVRQDFLLSNNAQGMDTLHKDLSSPMAALPADVVAPLIGVEGEYLDNAFDQLKKDYGSVEGFLAKELGVGPRQIAALKRNMLSR